MRSNEPIEITMKIPFPVDKPDGNGIIYTKEAIERAVKNFNSMVPLMINKDDVNTVVGDIDTIELSENYEVTAHGICYFGGSNEICNNIQNNTVTDFKFTSFGICEK